MAPLLRAKTRLMQPSDIGAGVRLARQAGWNQVEGDWEMWLELPHACAWVTQTGGRVIGSAAAIAYEKRVGWVGMVLVDPAFRRRGVATGLVVRAIQYLEKSGCGCQKLDATEFGQDLYSRFGFELEYEVQRWVRPPAPSPPPQDGGKIEVLDRSTLSQVEGLDRQAFGARRLEVLRLLLSTPVRGYFCRDSGHSGATPIIGYVAGRPGRLAVQLGPLVATNPETARLLVKCFLHDHGRHQIVADLNARNQQARALLEASGFSLSRRLQRMFRGENRFPGTPRQVYCLAGFEWG